MSSSITELPVTLNACPCGIKDVPAVVEMKGYFWVECQQCARESGALYSQKQAVSAWNRESNLPGHSALIAGLKRMAAVQLMC